MRKIAVMALALAACSGLPRAPMPEGKRLYLAKCTSCHAAYEPVRYAPGIWRENVDKMERLKKVTLSPEQRAEILQYLTGDATGRP